LQKAYKFKVRDEREKMTNPLTIAGVNSSAQVSAPAGAVVSSAAVPTSGSTNDTSKPLTADSNTSISPRIVVDPLAGVITQFLSSTGQVESQIPSSAVVAYLRAGLQADGLAKPAVTPKPQAATGGSSTVA
jgi:hypothetical protein